MLHEQYMNIQHKYQQLVDDRVSIIYLHLPWNFYIDIYNLSLNC